MSGYTSQFYCHMFAKVSPPPGRKQYVHHQFVSRCASHLYRDTFAELLGSGVVGTPPKNIRQEREHKHKLLGPEILCSTREGVSVRIERKQLSETQPKDRSFRPDVPSDIRPKTSVFGLIKSWKNNHFGTDMPRARPRKKLRSEKLRADFSFPKSRTVL